ncbi:response regulator transcription factor [Haloechinothrix halophila]|uniref:response regulator transcription factor n=1 Tax=Haloechinothrix halophila TaxID=1069073 RepID=UPI000410EAF8|nr:response regulator transcription factor [Haloechinothrix halophila]
MSIDARGQRMVTVGVADTEPLFRDGLATLIERTPWARMVAHSASQQGCLVMIDQLHPDVVLLTSELAPQCQFIHTLTTGGDAPRVVVVVSAHDRNSRYVAGTMAAGAYGAVARNADPHRFADAIRSVWHSHRYLDPTLRAMAGSVEQSSASAGNRGTQPLRIPLSRREFQVMQLIAEGMENAAIAKVLFLSVETVRTHVKSILRKLSARDRTHAVTIAFRSGLLQLTPLPPTETTSEENPVAAGSSPAS